MGFHGVKRKYDPKREAIYRARYLSRNPLCIKCKSVPHMNGDAYCYPCSRKSKGLGEPSVRRRKQNLEWCKVCGVRPRLSYHHYCAVCKRDYQNRTRAKKWAERYCNNELKRIETARAYATGLLARGKIKRQACVFCGDPGTQFHHYDYELRTRNFDDVCDPCHVLAHRFLNTLLTICRMRV